MKWKRIICKILGHRYQYNFGWAPNKCRCLRCDLKWKAVDNPNYIPGKSNPIYEDLKIWVKDND